MKRKEVKVTLSPNEEALLIREERERRRILRIQQVREQQRNIAQRVRQKVEQRRQQELDLLAEQLRAQWEREQKERVEHLEKLYQESLSLLGQGHRNAKENEPDTSVADQKAETESKAAERYRKALKELKLQRLKNQENQSRSTDARRKALEVEKLRAATVASLPPPPVQTLQEPVSKPLPVVKKCDANSFAATHYHLPKPLVDREMATQPSASVEAEQEAQRMTLVQKQEVQRREEQLEKARLRGREALRREQLLQDRGRFLVELEHMQQTDLRRRRQQVMDMPQQIFEPLYKRRDTQQNLQRDMEFAFEDMYSGERRVKGDLLHHLVPEPLPPTSTDSFCQDLDLSQDQTTNTEQNPTEDGQQTPPNLHLAEPETAVTAEEAADRGNTVRPAQGLKRLLTRIQSQRQHWSESDVASVDSPCGPDSIIDTGSLTTADKLSKTDMEHSTTVADKIQELEEQKMKEEALEREKLKQMETLEQLEAQRLKLEEELCEARRQKALQKITATSTESSTQHEPVTGSHSMIMEQHRRRLLQQNEIHQRSVEVARQRLEEYQRAIRLRQKAQTAPPASVPLTLQSSAVPLTVVAPSVEPPATVQPILAAPFVVPAAAFAQSAVPFLVPTALQPSAGSSSPPALLPPSVPPPPSLAPTAGPSATVRPPFVVPPAASLPAPFTESAFPSLVPSAFRPPPVAVALPAVTRFADLLHPPDRLNTLPTETVSRDMGPLCPSHPDLSSDSLTLLRHKAFLKFLQNRLGVTQCEAQSKRSGHPPSQSGPPVSTVSASGSPVPRRSDPSRPVSVTSAHSPPVPVTSAHSPPVPMTSGPSPPVPMVSTSSRPVSVASAPSPLMSMTSGPSPPVCLVSAQTPPVSMVSAHSRPVSVTSAHSRPVSVTSAHSCPVSVTSGPSPPISIKSGPDADGRALGLHQVISASTGSNASVFDNSSQEVTFPSLLVTMAASSSLPSLPASIVEGSSQVVPNPGPVSDQAEVLREIVAPGSSVLSRERPESLSDILNMTSQATLKVDVPPVNKQQKRSELLQALLRALEHSNIRTPQLKDSDQPSISGSSSASSGCSLVHSMPPSAAPKPPVSRPRLGCVDSVLHQLSMIEEVNTPASVSLLTGDVTTENFQESKHSDSSASLSGTLSDFAQYMDSLQSLDFESGANCSESSVNSTFKHHAQLDSRPQPSVSSTISTGSYISTDPELQPQDDLERVPAESPGSSPAPQSSHHDTKLSDQRTPSRTAKFTPVEMRKAVSADEPSLLENDESFRPLLAQIYEQSMCQAVDDVTLGAEGLTSGLELFLGHPSAHSSVIGQMPGAWDSTVISWREGLSYAPIETWQTTGQKFVPTERPLEDPEHESSADGSSSSGFHQLHAEVTHSQMETTEPVVPLRPQESSPEQMREEGPKSSGHVCSPPQYLPCPSLKRICQTPEEGVGILEQSVITLLSLTDCSSDEQDQEEEEKAEEEQEAKAHGHQTWAPALPENTENTVAEDQRDVHAVPKIQEFQRKILQRLRSKENAL